MTIFLVADRFSKYVLLYTVTGEALKQQASKFRTPYIQRRASDCCVDTAAVAEAKKSFSGL